MSLTFYFSGECRAAVRPHVAKHAKARLLSCHGSYLRAVKDWADVIKDVPEWRERHMMLDSGAYTAWKSGRPVTLEEVTRNYEQAMEWLEGLVGECWLINLDTIPGSPGSPASADDNAKAMADSDANHAALTKRFGRVVLPVYHQGEPPSRLAELCDQADYIGLSPRQGLTEKARSLWASQVHAGLAGRATATHGLATTGIGMLRGMGWHSVDSASWVRIAGFGEVCIWTGRQMLIMHISEKAPERGQWGGHYDNLSQPERERFDRQAQELGFPFGVLRESTEHRQIFNLVSFQHMADTVAGEVRNHALMGALF